MPVFENQYIDRERVSEKVVDLLKKYIIENKLKSGDRLPTEMELSKGLRVSRTAIREAIKVLESSGLIETIQGKGRFLREFNYDQLFDSLFYNLNVSLTDYWKVAKIRSGLERYFMPLTVPNLTPQDFNDLESIYDELKRQVADDEPYDEIVRTHAAFHKRIYRSLNNDLLEKLISMFSVFQQLFEKEEELETFLQKHRDLLDCLETKDVEIVIKDLDEHFIAPSSH